MTRRNTNNQEAQSLIKDQVSQEKEAHLSSLLDTVSNIKSVTSAVKSHLVDEEGLV